MNTLFDASMYAPDAGIDPVPADTYDVVIADTEKKNIQAGGWRLQLVYEILNGQYQGRKIMISYNIGGTNEENVRISNAQLSAVCHVTGIFKLSDTGNDREAAANLRGAQLKLKVSNDGKYNGHVQAYDTTGKAPAGRGSSTAAQPVASAPPTPPAAQPQQQTFVPPPPPAAQPQQPMTSPAPQVAFAPQQPQPQQSLAQGAPVQQQQATPSWNQAPAPQQPSWNQG